MTDWNPESFATSFQINVTCRCRIVRLAVERALAHRGDEALDRGVVDLLGLDPLGAGIAGKTRQAEMRAPARKLCHQTSPRGAKRRLGRALHGLQSADLHRGKEAGAKVGEGLGADPHRDRVDARQLGADRRQIERDAGRLFAQQARRPASPPSCKSRNRVAESEVSLFQGDEEVRQGDRRGLGGTASGAIRLTLGRHVLGPFGKLGLGHRVVSGGQRVTGADIREFYHRIYGTYACMKYSRYLISH